MTPDRDHDPTAPATERPGRVLTVSTGLVRVRCAGRVLRATVGADLLARIAREPSAAPRTGDRVRLLIWADGRVTVERVVARALPGTGGAGTGSLG